MSSEFDRIALLERIFQHPATSTRGSLQPDNPVQLGIGDDAAVLVPPTDGTAFVWTVDAAVEGVHFRRDWLSLEDIGYRSVIAAASDVLAMGGTPLWLLSALTFPEQFSDTDLAALATGQQGAADCLNATMVGGNLARSGILSMTTTVLGKAAHPITRRGAKPGDALWLIGEVGLAGAGLEYLRRGARDSSASARHCVAQWQRPSCYVNAPKLWRDAPPPCCHRPVRRLGG